LKAKVSAKNSTTQGNRFFIVFFMCLLREKPDYGDRGIMAATADAVGNGGVGLYPDCLVKNHLMDWEKGKPPFGKESLACCQLHFHPVSESGSALCE
jgi:hypothetical protein